MKISTICAKLFDELAKNNFKRAVIDINGRTPSKGFIVLNSMDLSHSVEGLVDFKDIVVFISDNKKLLNDNPEWCIGVKFDAATKQSVLNISSRMTKLSLAIAQARLNNQLDIFDLESKTELRIK